MKNNKNLLTILSEISVPRSNQTFAKFLRKCFTTAPRLYSPAIECSFIYLSPFVLCICPYVNTGLCQCLL